MSPGTQAIVALSALLVVWYVAGHLYNRQHGRRMRRWLGAGLDEPVSYTHLRAHET